MTFGALLDLVDVANHALPREDREVCAALRRHCGRLVFERREIDGTWVAWRDDPRLAAAPPTMDQVA